MFIEDGKRDEQVELSGEVVCPEDFPETADVVPGEFTFEPDEELAEEEEEFVGASTDEVGGEFGDHEGGELL